MRCFILKGFLVFYLIQHNTSEGVSTLIQFPTEVANQDGQSSPPEPELPIAKADPFVPPPCLKEVRQAMQEASQQVNGRGAGEVLKELLEKVVEAALGQVEAVGQEKDTALENKDLKQGVQGVKLEVKTKTLQQPQEGMNMSLEIGYNGFEESEVARTDAFINIAGGVKEVVKEERETVAGFTEEVTDRQAVGLEVTGESLLETKLTLQDVDSLLEETEGDLEARKENIEEQVVLIVLKNSTEKETQDGEETPATVEVAVGKHPEQEREKESKAGLGMLDKEQIQNSRIKQVALLEISQTDHADGEKTLPHPNDHVIQIKPVLRGPIKEEEEVRRGENIGGLSKADGLARIKPEENAKAEHKDSKKQIIGAKYGEVKDGSVALVVDRDVGVIGDEQIAAQDSQHNKKLQAMMTPGPQSEEGNEDFTEKLSEYQSTTPNLSFGAGPTADNDAKLNYNSRIITSNPGFVLQNQGRIQTTLGKFENDVFAEYHQDKGEKAKGTNAVQVLPGARDKDEQLFEAWKIGTIFTAVFLVLETVIIIIYILKCWNKESTPVMQQACEEGYVEPEATIGGDHSDDTLPEDKENFEKIVRHEPSDAASFMAIKREEAT